MWLNYLLSASSGCIYILACSPGDQNYFMWIAFIPLFFALDRLPQNKQTAWTTFKLGMTTAFFIAATGFYWLVHATQNYGEIPLFASVIIYLLFCLTNQIQVPVYVLLRRKLKTTPFFQKRFILTSFVLGVAYAGIESFNPKLFTDTAGSAFYNAAWIRQLADLGGPFVITIFALAINELLFRALQTKKLKSVWVVAALAVLMSSYGRYRTHEYQTIQATPTDPAVFHASVIQGNIGDFMKVAAERGEVKAITQVMGQYLSLSDQAMKQTPSPDAVIWPETAYPAIFGRPLSTMEVQLEQMLRSLLDRTKGYLIFGGYDNDIRNLEYNSIFFVKPSAQEKNTYHKSTLLMFGETLPLADTFPTMKTWFPTMGFFGRGPGPGVVSLKNTAGVEFKMAPSICYEALFTDFSVIGALAGADVLLNVTNDSWFGEHGEPYQHLSLTRFRSIETRLPLLRATNTGFSVFIDPTGEQTQTTALSQAEIMTVDIHHRMFPESPYMVMAKIFGANWFVVWLQLFTAVLVLYVWVKRKA